jgi:hypothetical protein
MPSIDQIFALKEMSSGSTWKDTLTLLNHSEEYISTAVGLETVTVPAGIFEAMKVQIDAVSVADDIGFRWYAPGVGLIKMHNKASWGEATHELVSYVIPK